MRASNFVHTYKPIKNYIMKSKIIISALLLSVTLLTAQTENKQTTVRIKNVEKVNGVETIKDTVYTINGPVTLETLDGLNTMEGNTEKDGKPKKMVIITDQISGDDKNTKVISIDENIDEQVESALKVAGATRKDIDKMVMINIDDKKTGDGKGTVKVLIIKKIAITDPTEADTKVLGKQTGITDGMLLLDNMNFYPNPNNGKFNLAFDLKDKGDTEINIMNLEGKNIYTEKLSNFSGHYDKEMDISKNPKGSYFVRIQQGKHAQLKKIVLE